MISDILDIIVSHGDRGAVVPIARIDDLKNDMFALKNGDFHTSWLDRIADHMAGPLNRILSVDINFAPRSLISVLMPSPKVMLQFNYQGNSIQCAVPPHYTDWELKNKRVWKYLNGFLNPRGFSAAIVVTIPQKLLAVHCGLAVYGRNNICYNDDFGSFMQIITFVSDLPCDEAAWFPVSRMESCNDCCACVNACPTGAIDSQRPLINSDRCLTIFNEFPDPFPEWLDKDAHNSITGCTMCQDCCPANAHNMDSVKKGVSFTEEETVELLNHKDDTPYTGSLAGKIEATGILPDFTRAFSRNLTVLLKK